MRTMHRDCKGFTLLELAAVAAIMGIAITMFIMKADNVTTAARLNAASRLVGSSVELALSDAVMKRERRSVVYDPGRNAVRVEKESGQDPREGRVLSEHILPAGVEITDVEGLEATGEEIVVVVSPSGRMAPHAVHIRNGAGEMTVEVYGITGKIRYHRGRVELRRFTREAEVE